MKIKRLQSEIGAKILNTHNRQMKGQLWKEVD